MAAYLVLGTQDAEMMDRIGQNENGEWQSNMAYGALVARVLPDWLLGFFAAVVVGSILSTFNSVLNSAATLFSLDVFKKYIAPSASTKTVVRSGQICSLLVGIFAVVAAPMVFHGQSGVFDFFQGLNGVYFIPLLAIIMYGMFDRSADGTSALITLIVGLALMVAGTFFTGGDEGWLKFIFGRGYHYMGAVFASLLVLQFVLKTAGMKLSQPWVQEDVKAVDLTPWKPAPIVGGLLVVFALAIYIYFAQ
jgi:SSS family solute:Na+ symporter